MPQSLDTIPTAEGIEYHHAALGHIATKVFHPETCWGLVPVDGQAAKVCARLFGTTAGIGCETADWLALALAAQLVEEGPEVIEGAGQYRAGRGAIVSQWHNTPEAALEEYRQLSAA